MTENETETTEGKDIQTDVVFGADAEQTAKIACRVEGSQYKVLAVSESMKPHLQDAKEIIEEVYDESNNNDWNASMDMNISEFEVVEEVKEPATRHIDLDERIIWE